MDSQAEQLLKDIANKLRIHSIQMTNASNSGHPTSCCSMAEIISVLFFHTMRFKVAFPKDPNNDRLVLSKGHAAPILYAAWAEAGLFPASELLNLRKIGSDLEGHPTPRLNFVDIATGSLGQGLAAACGMAYNGKFFEKSSYRVYCLMGDGETAEGSVWEAAAFAGHYQLDNLVGIVDVNRLGQSDPTALQHNLNVYQQRWAAFGWNSIVVDGHDVVSLAAAFNNAKETGGKPTMVLAKSLKGKGIPGVEDQMNWHGKPLGKTADETVKQIEALIVNHGPYQVVNNDIPSTLLPVGEELVRLSEPPNYNPDDKVATRFAYGTALVKLGKTCQRVVVLDGDTKNSTFSETFKKAFPDRYVECFIAEQNVVGVSIGLATRGRCITFASTFATFFTRAFDQLRMGAVSQTSANFCGSHCGVSIGEDGPSQMGLEDIAMFRAIPGCVVFYPSDAVSMERAIELAANSKTMTFTRTSRPATKILYNNNEVFCIGKSKVVLQSSSDKALVIGAGVTLHEALEAAGILAASGVNVRVLDLFTVKPIDAEGILHHALECGGKVLTVEDHYPEGGIGEAVASALAEHTQIQVKRLAVNGVPRSGQPHELLDMFRISAKWIVETLRGFV